MKGNTRVSMVLARMLTAILAVTGLAVVAPVAHAVDNPTITLDARSMPIRSADTPHAYTAYLVAEYDLSNVQPNATQSTYLDASGVAFFTVIGATVITLAGVFAPERARLPDSWPDRVTTLR